MTTTAQTADAGVVACARSLTPGRALAHVLGSAFASTAWIGGLTAGARRVTVA
jgi:hypothetical protein